MPQRPKPPIRIVAPSGMSATAASASGEDFVHRDHATAVELSASATRASVRPRRPRRADRRPRDRRADPAAAAISVSSAAPISSALVAAMSFQISAGSRRAASCPPARGRRAPSPSSPTASPTTCISALAVSCGRWLRNASSRSCASTLDHARHGAERPRERHQLLERLARRIARRREQPGRPLNRSGRACSSPLAAAPAERMPADEREPRRQARAPPRRSPASCCRCR